MNRKHWVIYPPVDSDTETQVRVVDQSENSRFYLVDDDTVEIVSCVCGNLTGQFDFLAYRNKAVQCPKCGRWFYFKTEHHLYEVIGEHADSTK